MYSWLIASVYNLTIIEHLAVWFTVYFKPLKANVGPIFICEGQVIVLSHILERRNAVWSMRYVDELWVDFLKVTFDCFTCAGVEFQFFFKVTGGVLNSSRYKLIRMSFTEFELRPYSAPWNLISFAVALRFQVFSLSISMTSTTSPSSAWSISTTVYFFQQLFQFASSASWVVCCI